MGRETHAKCAVKYKYNEFFVLQFIASLFASKRRIS
jgi:hypothetical protein